MLLLYTLSLFSEVDSYNNNSYVHINNSMITNSNIGYNNLETSGSEDMKNIKIKESFSKVDINVPANLNINMSQNQKITVSSDINVINKIKFKVKNDTLFIRLKEDVSSYSSLDILINTSILKLLNVDGSIDAIVSGFNLNNFTLLVNGACDVSLLSMSINTFNLKADGSYDINMKETITSNATINARGSGDIIINVDKKLNVNLQDTVEVSYSGDPKIKKHIKDTAELLKN